METVTTRGNEVVIPLELWEALRRPSTVNAFQNPQGDRYVVVCGPAAILKSRIRNLLRRKPVDSTGWYRLGKRDTEAVRFTLHRGRPVGRDNEQSFRIANYGSTVQLLPVLADDDVATRQTAWAEIEGYHEHLPYVEQEKSATEFSRWFATVCAQFAPQSVLELGCGAGRNLFWIHDALPSAELSGIEVNPRAVAEARRQLPSSVRIVEDSIHDLTGVKSKSMDIVFTSGVLMHIPSNHIEQIIREAHRIARCAVIHFELHGESQAYDYHRYPRNYEDVYKGFDLGTEVTYQIFPNGDFRSKIPPPFRHSLLISRR